MIHFQDMVALDSDNPEIPTKWSTSAPFLFCKDEADRKFSGYFLLDY